METQKDIINKMRTDLHELNAELKGVDLTHAFSELENLIGAINCIVSTIYSDIEGIDNKHNEYSPEKNERYKQSINNKLLQIDTLINLCPIVLTRDAVVAAENIGYHAEQLTQLHTINTVKQ